MESQQKTDVYEFRHFHVVVLTKRINDWFYLQNFTFEIDFHKFVLTNEQAEFITTHLKIFKMWTHTLTFGCQLKLHIDLGFHQTLVVCLEEVSALLDLITQKKFVQI